MLSTGSVGTSIAVNVAVRRAGAPFSKMSFSTLTLNLLQHIYQVINVLLCARLGHAEEHATVHAGIALAKWVATDDAGLVEVLLQALYWNRNFYHKLIEEWAVKGGFVAGKRCNLPEGVVGLLEAEFAKFAETLLAQCRHIDGCANCQQGLVGADI